MFQKKCGTLINYKWQAEEIQVPHSLENALWCERVAHCLYFMKNAIKRICDVRSRQER